MIWQEIDGWLTEGEGAKLQELAKARRVLELGTWKGRSAACMARTALSVTTVDSHSGDASTGPASTRAEFEANMEACQATGRVEPLFGRIEELAAELRGRRFDMVFIDGSHDAASVKHDTELAADVLTPGGVIVWHDYNYESVRNGIEATGLDLSYVQQHEALGVLQSAKWQVAVTMPYSLTIEPEAYDSMRGASIGRFTDAVIDARLKCGGLTQNFNMLLDVACQLRDEGRVTHWLLHHSDIAAERGYLDLLAEEMHQHSTVAISAVIPIKEHEMDRTSTAIGSRADPWEPLRYVMVRDKDRLPVTFTGKDVCTNDDEVLLINTGLMLVDLRCDFWTDYTFRVLNKRGRPNGKYKSFFRSEDWEMSRDLDAAGLRYASTWRPYAEHIGSSTWPNRPRLQVISNSAVKGG